MRNCFCARVKSGCWKSRLPSWTLIFLIGIATTGAAAAGEHMLAIGNSMTFHSPSPELGWEGQWGMAASARHHDYVGQLMELLRQVDGQLPTPERLNLSALERTSGEFKLPEGLAATASRSKYVVVFLGDNVDSASDEQVAIFRRNYSDLLRAIRHPGQVLACVGTYWTRPAVDQAIAEACTREGGVYVAVGDLRKVPGTDAAYLQKASREVRRHPGDGGMRLIARRIALSLQSRPGNR